MGKFEGGKGLYLRCFELLTKFEGHEAYKIYAKEVSYGQPLPGLRAVQEAWKDKWNGLTRTITSTLRISLP